MNNNKIISYRSQRNLETFKIQGNVANNLT